MKSKIEKQIEELNMELRNIEAYYFMEYDDENELIKELEQDKNYKKIENKINKLIVKLEKK